MGRRPSLSTAILVPSAFSTEPMYFSVIGGGGGGPLGHGWRRGRGRERPWRRRPGGARRGWRRRLGRKTERVPAHVGRFDPRHLQLLELDLGRRFRLVGRAACGGRRAVGHAAPSRGGVVHRPHDNRRDNREAEDPGEPRRAAFIGHWWAAPPQRRSGNRSTPAAPPTKRRLRRCLQSGSRSRSRRNPPSFRDRR